MSAAVRRVLPALGGALALIVIFVTVLSLPLSAAEPLGLSDLQTASWIAALYGVSALFGLALTLRFRQPLVLTGNIFIIIFVVRLAGDLAWAELIGASMLAGALVLVIGVLGLTDRLAEWLPAPIVFGLLAGAVLPFFVDLFAVLGQDAVLDGVEVTSGERLMVAGALVAYLAGRRWAEPRMPALLPALVVGLVIAGLTGGYGPAPDGDPLVAPRLTAPVFSLAAILTASPVMVAFITLQANIPSVVYLRSQGYRPPERTITAISGASTLIGSLLGPMGVSLSLPATALTAGPDAGERGLRFLGATVALAFAVLIALLSGLASELATVVARPLLVALVGLAVVGVLVRALQEVTKGPLLLGPLFAFAVALTDVRVLGLGSFFWALPVGLGVSLLLELRGWQELRTRVGERRSSDDGTGQTPRAPVRDRLEDGG